MNVDEITLMSSIVFRLIQQRKRPDIHLYCCIKRITIEDINLINKTGLLYSINVFTCIT
jgi:hypothetical protein